jgi:hypothetical protein
LPVLNLFNRERKMLKSLLLVLLAGLHVVQAQSPVQREYQVKAAFLYNFSQFVEWPESSFSSVSAPFVIGILGNDPFGSFLDEIVSGEKTMGRPIIVKRYKDIKDAADCQILFVSENALESNDLSHPQNILMVSDADNFINAGGMIRFFKENGKIRFQINTAAVKAANLAISSKLLRVATVIDK